MRLLAFLFAWSAAAQPHPWRTVVMGTNGMVAAEHPLQAMAGLDVLKAGGNAIDAAVATFFMTGVTEQHQAGIGGDGYILAYIAKLNKVVFINGTGPAPKLATIEAYRKLGGIPHEGIHSSNVPGSLAAFDLAWRQYGSRPWKSLLTAAIETARKGHPLTHWSASNHTEAVEKIKPFPSSVKILLPSGRPQGPGEIFIQPDLARTLQTIAQQGAASFYKGSLARQTAAFYEKQGGFLRYDDLASFTAESADPIRVNYKDYEVYQSAPNSQGIVLLMALKILEGVDMKALGQNSAAYIHMVTEALKLAFADRTEYISDPRYVKDMPVEQLLSASYAAKRRALIQKDKAIQGVAPPGDPRGGKAILAGRTIAWDNSIRRPQSPPAADGETSSFSIADKFGNFVSVTHSVNSTFGSGVFVEGTGFVLNNRTPYFSLDAGNVNVLAAGKRTRHTINPAMALKNGKPFLAWNTPGGDNQPQAMLQAFLNVVEFGMNVQQALEQPTVTTNSFAASMYPHKDGDTLVVPAVLARQIGAALSAKGHRVQEVEKQQPYNQQAAGAGAVKMILIDPATGVMHGGVSPAKDDYVLGW